MVDRRLSSNSKQNLFDSVQQYLTDQPDSNMLDLTDQEIVDLTVIYDQLTRFNELKELNLSNNNFTRIPADMSKLHKVENLNLQNIEFSDFSQCVKSLATMPALRSLYINLMEEEQVDLIMKNLPNLEYLNGLPVDRDDVED